jgi:hypothetical protein
MPRSAFGGARSKVERANKHIGDLEVAFATFLKKDFYALNVQTDSQSGQCHLSFHLTAFPSPDIPLIIGDAVHNLRSALDLMIYDIALIDNKVPDRHTKFPVRLEWKEISGALKSAQIERPDIIALIINDIKPYKNGGNEALCALHDLDITDKHHVLITTYSPTFIRNILIENEDGELKSISVPLRKGQLTNVPVYSVHGKVKLKDKGKPAGDIFFLEGVTFWMEPVIPTLQQLSQLVMGIIQVLEKPFLVMGEGGHMVPPIIEV